MMTVRLRVLLGSAMLVLTALAPVGAASAVGHVDSEPSAGWILRAPAGWVVSIGTSEGAGSPGAMGNPSSDPAGDLVDLPETDTETRSREAPPLEVLVVAGVAGLGLGVYLFRRRNS